MSVWLSSGCKTVPKVEAYSNRKKSLSSGNEEKRPFNMLSKNEKNQLRDALFHNMQLIMMRHL